MLATLENLFTPKLNVSANSQVLSNTVTLSGNGIISFVDGNFTFYKNSQLTSLPTNYTNGDVIQLSLQSSQDYTDSTHAVIQVNGDNHVFTCVTVPEYTVVESELAKDPFEITQYRDGSEFSASNDTNRVIKYSDTFAQVSTKAINLSNTSSSVISDEEDSVIFCSFFDKKLYRFSVSTGEISGIISVSGTPYGVVAAPRNPSNNLISDLWVTLSDTNKVVVLDNTDSVIREFTVGSRPMGITINPNGNMVVVANNKSDTITKFNWSGSDWVMSTVSIGSRPFEVAIDKKDNIWVTCSGDNKVYKISFDNGTTSYSVGNIPRGIAYLNDKIWVAVSLDNKLVALDSSGNITNTINNIGNIPLHISCVGTLLPVNKQLTESIAVTDTISTKKDGKLSLDDSVGVSDGTPDIVRYFYYTLPLSDTVAITDGPNTVEIITILDKKFNYVSLQITAE